jgi:probable rRNA maturation factor
LALLWFLEQASLFSFFIESRYGRRSSFPGLLTQSLRKMILIEPPRSTIAARRYPLNRQELARFAVLAVEAAGARGGVAVLLTNDQRIQELNRQFRGKNAPTDVLSFPAVDWAANGHRGKSAGDLAISLETAARQAEGFGHPLATEVKVLILHGALHLAGFDHETDSGEMARKELRLRRRLGLPSGLIERGSSEAGLAKGPRKLSVPVRVSESNGRKPARGRA